MSGHTSPAASEFVRHGTGTYAYDRNGALCRDENRGIDSIEYDLLGNLKKILFTGDRSIEYVYSASGEKLREIHKRPRTYIRLQHASGGTIIPDMNVFICDTTDYLGPLILRKGHPEMLRFDGGYISFTSDTISGIHYYIQDYMGNIRMVVNGRTDSIEQVTHYYPYGGVIGDISTNESLQKFKFEGKELDRTFGLDNYDIHARQYFAMAPMWDRPDQLAHKYYGISPYVYCGGDPVNYGDYNGKVIVIPENESEEFKRQYFATREFMRQKGSDTFLLQLEASNTKYTVTSDWKSNGGNSFFYYNSETKTIVADFSKGLITKEGMMMSPATCFGHEVFHAAEDDTATQDKTRPREQTLTGDDYDKVEERKNIMYNEQNIARLHGEIGTGQVTRTSHQGGKYYHINGTLDPVSVSIYVGEYNHVTSMDLQSPGFQIDNQIRDKLMRTSSSIIINL